jgi:hypothetical protein
MARKHYEVMGTFRKTFAEKRIIVCNGPAWNVSARTGRGIVRRLSTRNDQNYKMFWLEAEAGARVPK